MIFTETKLRGTYLIDIHKLPDERGFFARTWCDREAQAHGLRAPMVQCSISFNNEKGTLRGMHYHAAPFKQSRLVSCLRGSVFVAGVDLRSRSPTFLQNLCLALEADSYRAIYIPEGLALGYQTLEQNTEIYYQMTEFYDPAYERGFRWNDPAFDIRWPDEDRTIKDRDNNYADFRLETVSQFSEY